MSHAKTHIQVKFETLILFEVINKLSTLCGRARVYYKKRYVRQKYQCLFINKLLTSQGLRKKVTRSTKLTTKSY